jgi:hypothetical protein
MSNSRLKQTTRHYNALLAQHDAAAQRSLSNAYTHTLAQIQPHLNKLLQQIREKRARGEQVPASWLYEQHRLETIKQTVNNAITHYGQITQAQVADLQRFGVQTGTQSAQDMLQASVPRGISHMFGVPDPQALHNLVGATQPGSPLHSLFNTFGSQAADDVGKALFTGLSLGNSPTAVARAVQDALDIPRARALTIARTEMNRAYRSANLLNYQTNSDVVDSWIWCCDMGPHSCAACIFMNGSEHSLDEDMDEHVCGRCTPIPKTKSWADILGDGVDTSDLEDTSPDVQDGSDWFDNQDEGTQRDILGTAKYEAYANGDISLRDVVGVRTSSTWGNSVYVRSLAQAKGN